METQFQNKFTNTHLSSPQQDCSPEPPPCKDQEWLLALWPLSLLNGWITGAQIGCRAWPTSYSWWQWGSNLGMCDLKGQDFSKISLKYIIENRLIFFKKTELWFYKENQRKAEVNKQKIVLGPASWELNHSPCRRHTLRTVAREQFQHENLHRESEGLTRVLWEN